MQHKNRSTQRVGTVLFWEKRPSSTGGDGKIKEVFLPRFLGRTTGVLADEIIQEKFAGTRHLFQAAKILRVFQCHIEELQSAVQCRFGLDGIVFFASAERALHFASDIGHLFDKRELPPAYGRQIFMKSDLRSVHRVTNPATTLLIFSRVCSSSTFLLLFPWRGRTLIIESNSMKSSPVLSG